MKGHTCSHKALFLLAIIAGSNFQACEAAEGEGFGAKWGLSFYAQDPDGSSQGGVKVNSLLYKEDEVRRHLICFPASIRDAGGMLRFG